LRETVQAAMRGRLWQRGVALEFCLVEHGWHPVRAVTPRVVSFRSEVDRLRAKRLLIVPQPLRMTLTAHARVEVA
jgi:hypothetical protein